MDSSKGYTYEWMDSTKSVRLMVLLPSRFGAGLRCLLHVVKSDQLADYEAISYTWGDETSTTSIRCGSKEIPITKNLESALIHFRTENEPRILWTDRICINQDHVVERSNQVSLMGQIYARADRVLIWLGHEDQYTVPAFSYIKMIQNRVMKRGTHPPITAFTQNAAACAFFGLPDFNSTEYSSLLKLLDRPWFKRAWCYQESVLAQTSLLHCGSFTTAGDDMFALCACLQYLDLQRDFPSLSFTATEWTGHLAAMFHTVTNMKEHGQEELFDILQILTKRRGVGATDSRDLIYSLLGVAKDVEDIKPDYTLSVNEVFISTAFHIIRGRHDLALLGRVLEPSAELPTWVPDWRSSTFDWAFSVVSNKYYNATGSSWAFPEPTESLNTLQLQGLRVNNIDLFMDYTYSRGWKIALYDLASSLARQTGCKKAYKHTNEPWDCALFRTLTGDLMKTPQGWKRWSRRSFNHMMQGKLQIKMAKQGLDLQEHHRQFFITQDKRIGLAPLHARQGDVVCLLFGGEVPLLLREAENGYTFVGECYVHGLMDGEGLVEARKRAHPEWDSKETAWLNELRSGHLQFDTEDFVIR
jgi:hypothetical protein